jgi:EXPERA (EXPanded EBP superfamily)
VLHFIFSGGCRWIRLPALLYGCHVATTVIPIIYHIMMADFSVCGETPSIIKSLGISGPETLSERLILSSIYAPYLLVPLLLVYTMLFSPDYATLKSKSS